MVKLGVILLSDFASSKLFFSAFFFFLVLAGSSLADLEINEVMYAPSTFLGSNNEWVELYNSGNYSWNLNNCTLDGKALPNQVLNGNQYLVLARDLALFNASYPNMPAVKIIMTLNNDGDTIILKCALNSSSNYEKNFSYTSSSKAFRNNLTLERRSDGTWDESMLEFGTPGRENSIFDLSSTYQDLMISEIFPDPFFEDWNPKPEGEWIELYNGGKKTLSLKGLMFKDDDDENELYIVDTKVLSLNGLFLKPGEYKVIYRDGDTDFALNNEGSETIRLFYGEELIDEVSYSGSTSGMSWSNIEGDFYLTAPTPNKINQISEDCDWFLTFDSGSSIYQSDTLDFDLYVSRFIGTSGNVTVKGKIEDAFGETIKEYSPWNNVLIDEQRMVSYSPNLPEGIYQVIFWIEELDCNEMDDTDNQVNEILAINPQYQVFTSSLAITEVYLGSDDSAEWGEQFLVKINVYKGNSTKTAIELWAEKGDEVVSKRSKVNIYEKFQNYTLSLPLQLDVNCEGEEEDLELVLSGLDLEVRQNFKVEGADKNLCEIETISASSGTAKSKKSSFQIVDLIPITSAGAVLPIKLQINNGNEQEEAYEVWSYLYRGNKCYSCQSGKKERDSNKKQVSVKKNGIQSFNLYSVLDTTIDPGEYKLKVKIKPEGQKTEKDLTETIYVQEKTGSLLTAGLTSSSAGEITGSSVYGTSNSADPSRVMESKSSANGIVIYQSSSVKSLSFLPYILLTTLVLVGIILFLKRSFT